KQQARTVRARTPRHSKRMKQADADEFVEDKCGDTAEDPPAASEDQANGIDDAKKQPHGVDGERLLADVFFLIQPAQRSQNDPSDDGEGGETDQMQYGHGTGRGQSHRVAEIADR